MTWITDTLAELREAVEDAFQTVGIHTPMIAKPNERAKADATRPPYELVGIFDEPAQNVSIDQSRKDGLNATHISSTNPTFSVQVSRFQYLPTQGDLIELPEIGRRFRVNDIRRDIPGMSVLALEDLGRIPAA